MTEADIRRIRKLLDQALNGTMLDQFNHDDDGLVDDRAPTRASKSARTHIQAAIDILDRA